MKRFLFSIISLILFSVFAYSQTEEPKRFEIYRCSPKLTEAGRQSSFRFNYRYLISTDEKGLVKKVIWLNSKDVNTSLVDLSGVIPCLEKLKLSSSKSYLIYISVGTTGGENFISFSNKDESIKIIL